MKLFEKHEGNSRNIQQKVSATYGKRVEVRSAQIPTLLHIGNLTLLEKKLKRDAGQQSYVEKCRFYEQSNSELTKAIPEHYESWNESKLSFRQQALEKLARAVWRLQQLGN